MESERNAYIKKSITSHVPLAAEEMYENSNYNQNAYQKVLLFQ